MQTFPHTLQAYQVVFFCTIISIPGMGAALRAYSARSSSRVRPPCFGSGSLIQPNTYSY